MKFITKSILLLLVMMVSCKKKEIVNYKTDIAIKKENASLAAQKIMDQSFYFDTIDEFTPFGNFIGGDTFYSYCEWRNQNPNTNVKKFVVENMWELGIFNFDLSLNSESKQDLNLAIEALPNKYVDLNHIDNLIISVAFTQLFLDGSIDENVRDFAKNAISRELVYIDFWEEDSEIRKDRLLLMDKALSQIKLKNE